MSTSTRDVIVVAARRLFAERGYTAVTIRDIAAEAGVSPGLVIKLTGSKAELHLEAGPPLPPLAELGLPRHSLGRALVLRMLQRRENDLPEPYLNAIQRIHESPTPDSTRADVTATFLGAVAELIGDESREHTHAATVICLLTGLAAGIRTWGLFTEPGVTREELVGLYAPLVQAQVDACQGSGAAS